MTNLKNENEASTSILMIAHGAVAESMLNALEFITGPQPTFRALALDHALDVDKARGIVIDSIDDMMTGAGVLILTDLFGGAPSNIAMSILDERFIEIVAGFNMPMLIQAVTLDSGLSLREKSEKLKDYGRDNIFVATEILSGHKK